ncbi:MAG: phytanoyl-CoA dioxygenase family protein [Sphingobacteriales bacterium]|nr:phytanoyl-CoA dioxygenase family protein [Sphingobacteriales bacterium]OJW31633.1 MAG: phytanoyl-CoA dioxygenase [Sphingobacteriales bacterium 46-32]
MREIFQRQGFFIKEDILSAEQIDELTFIIENSASVKSVNASFRRSAGLFAIRKILLEIPGILDLLKQTGLFQFIENSFGKDYFIVKSIYFNKPAASNWFVAWHQDLTISVKEKADIDGFGPWTVKPGQFAVQPPLSILEDNFTVRLHLDNTTVQNGALKVVPGSHRKGIYRTGDKNWSSENEVICEVPAGGMMLMKPLLLHSSSRSTNNQQRRVIHIEFSRQTLPAPLRWSEMIE